jgi:hypothetical protein
MSLAPEQLFAVACPGCRATVAVDRGLVGDAARCPLCAAGFLVPDPGPAPPAERVSPPSPADRAHDVIPAPAASGAAAAPPEAAPARLVPPADDQPGRAPREEPLPHPVGADVGAAPDRRLAKDERSRRRSRRTLVIMIGGITILLALAATLGRRPRRSRR